MPSSLPRPVQVIWIGALIVSTLPGAAAVPLQGEVAPLLDELPDLLPRHGDGPEPPEPPADDPKPPTVEPDPPAPAARDPPASTPREPDGELETRRRPGRRPTTQDRTPAPSPDAGGPSPPAAVAALGLGAGVLAFALYRRLDRTEILENPTRSALHRTVQDAPGGTATEYAGRVGVDRTTARYHLELLEEYDLVRSKRLRGRRRWYENHGRYGRFAVHAIAHLRQTSTRRIVHALLEDPDQNPAELARRLGLSKSVVYRRVGRLDDLDVVAVRHREGRKRVRVPEHRQGRVRELLDIVEGAVEEA